MSCSAIFWCRCIDTVSSDISNFNIVALEVKPILATFHFQYRSMSYAPILAILHGYNSFAYCNILFFIFVHKLLRRFFVCCICCSFEPLFVGKTKENFLLREIERDHCKLLCWWDICNLYSCSVEVHLFTGELGQGTS